jgi:hypothetical protein
VATWGVVCHSTKSSECVQRLSFESTSILMMVNDKTVCTARDGSEDRRGEGG